MREIRNEALVGAVIRMTPDYSRLAVRYLEVKKGDVLRPGRGARP